MKMSPKKFSAQIYAIIGKHTPIDADCGKLCNCACCAVTDEITGMYLFPCENKMYEKMPAWGKIYDTDFTYGNNKYADLFTCTGSCERNRRPLSCRIFPLTPYIDKDGKLEIIIDPRGKGICPIASVIKKEELSPAFVKSVERAMKICAAVRPVREFIYALSRSIDEML